MPVVPVAAEWLALSGAPAFQRVLQQRPSAKSAHFAVHCLRWDELSTGKAPVVVGPVDDLPRVPRPARHPGAPRLGLVVPKRHARRSVTRNQVKRQVRAAWEAWWREGALPGTDWVVRLRGPIDRKQFISARSELLGVMLRDELCGLLAQAARRAGLSAPRAAAP